MKKKFFLGFVLMLLGGVLVCSDLSAQPTAAKPAASSTPAKRVRCDGLGQDAAARRAVRAWLRLVDSGDYQQSWYAGSELIRCYHTLEGWQKYLQKTRRCLRRVCSRGVIESEECGNPARMPEGTYYWIKYATTFTDGCDHIGECGYEPCEKNEVIILRCECDCAAGTRWRVCHYDVR